VQVVLWVVVWPVLGALALLARPQRASWHLVVAVVLLVAVAPAWAAAWLVPQAGEPDVAAVERGDGPDEASEHEEPTDGEAGAAGSDEADAEPEDLADEDPGGAGTADEGSGAEGAGEEVSRGERGADVSGLLEVHFIDVGQADATLLLHEDVAVLVDAGHWQRSDVVPYLHSQGVDRLDLVVVTHPHADHIGQFDQVMDAFDVAEVWWSGSTTTTQTFGRALSALERSDAAYEEPRAGSSTVIGPLSIDIVNPPAGVNLPDLHDASLGFTVTYGDVVLLFTGDAEAATERRMVDGAGGRLRADILQLGHHGSSTSTTAPFLSAVDPEVAVYSAGAGNQYGHPHAEVLERLQSAGVEVYGTDVHGHVVVSTDGVSWSVSSDHSGSVTAAPPSDTTEQQARAPPDPDEVPAEQPLASSDSCGPGQVDINSAGFEELQEIIHIGPARAEDIIRLRPFASVDSMTGIDGIAAGRLADIKQQGVACAG
jgi:competence protein ComEC